MGFKKCNSSISLNDVLNKTSEFDILTFYFGINTLPILINSPLREDKNASMSLFTPNNKKILYKDFGSGDNGSLFDLLGKMWNLSFRDTLEKINQDIDITSSSRVKLGKSKHKIIHKSNSTLNVKTREWSVDDLLYWQSYGISLEWLQFGDVYPISHILITRDNHTTIIAADKLAYAYVEHKDSKVSLKVYQPKSDHMKWLSKHDASVWDLWAKLPQEGERLFITSSRKDALCLWANTGIPSVSLQGEGYIPKPQVINELKQRFKKIMIFFDNDFDAKENHGHLYATNLCKMFGLTMVEIPSQYKSKDPSDLYKNVGAKEFRRIIRELIISNNQNISTQ